VPQEQVATLAREHYSGVTERTRRVIRSEEEWAALWDSIYARRTPTPPRPAVDFTESVVVVASLGERSSGGYAIDVTDVYRTSSELHVIVREASPDRSCVTSAAITQPVVAVSVPSSEAVTFVERRFVHDC
jgi:hypothetical protein